MTRASEIGSWNWPSSATDQTDKQLLRAGWAWWTDIELMFMCHQLSKSQETILRRTVNHNRIHNQHQDLLDFPSCEDWLCTVSHSCGACQGFASATPTNSSPQQSTPIFRFCRVLASNDFYWQPRESNSSACATMSEGTEQ